MALRSLSTVVLVFVLTGPAVGQTVFQVEGLPAPKSPAYEWLDVALEATAREVERDGARPTIDSRSLGVAVTAMHDAWAAYDPKAVGTRLGGELRGPKSKRTVKNKEKAIAYAVYRVLLEVYPEDAEWCREQMRARLRSR